MPFKNLNDINFNLFSIYQKKIDKKFNFEYSKNNNYIHINSNDNFNINKSSYSILDCPTSVIFNNNSINHELLYNNNLFGYGFDNELNINLFNEFNYNNNITTNLNIKTNPDNLSNSSLETSLLFKGKNQYAGIYYNYIYKKKFFIESLIGYNTDYCDTNIKFIFENSLAASIILNTNAKINKNINIGCGIMYNYYNFIKYNYIFNIDYQYDNDNKLSILTNYNDFTIIPTIVHKLCDNCFLHFSLELNKKFDPKYGVGIYLNL
jgi:hypothetical protein